MPCAQRQASQPGERDREIAEPAFSKPMALLSGVKGISFVYFDEKDVVRHKLVQAIVRAYDAHGAAQTPAR